MKKRIHLEQHFNKHLEGQELIVKFIGENEFVLIGAPTNNLKSRILLCLAGIALVSITLITGFDPITKYHNAFVISGSLTGLIMACTPFISFYSKKNFKIVFSRKLRRLSIEKGISPDKRIDFSNVDFLQVKLHVEDDLVSGVEVIQNYSHEFLAVNQGVVKELFILYSSEKGFDEFVKEFAEFVATFMGKELKLARG